MIQALNCGLPGVGKTTLARDHAHLINAVNIFRNMLGLPETKWKRSEKDRTHRDSPASDSDQHTPSYFLAYQPSIERNGLFLY